jgi:hypothetical protein
LSSEAPRTSQKAAVAWVGPFSLSSFAASSIIWYSCPGALGRFSVTKYLIPLLPAGALFHSQLNSKSSNFSESICSLFHLPLMIADPLAQAGIRIFALSTFDTEYVLVKKESFSAAPKVLTESGHCIRE